MAVLHTCIQEYEGLPDDTLPLLMSPLLPAQKKDNPISYKVIGVVIQACATTLQHICTKTLSDLLMAYTHTHTHTQEEGEDEGYGHKHTDIHTLSDLQEDVYVLLYELHKLSPILVEDSLPVLSLQLKTENEDTRIKAVKILSRLYLSPHDYLGAHAEVWKIFVSRLHDISSHVRLEVLRGCEGIVQSKGGGVMEMVEGEVAKRLRDPDEEVSGV
ncbi:hypothetical protein EON65_24585 [archaeon]|nr:MAG: hypothetical protein EON65_24585 [archaeon]